ncbi:MAG: hypothetical protein HWN67_19000 [Candidatus Helarchaeota archaeon]|nr:hypothetical protein [Candidatus Helarchaeota archaeon]
MKFEKTGPILLQNNGLNYMNNEITEKKIDAQASIEEQEQIILTMEKGLQESLKEKTETCENLEQRLIENKQMNEQMIEDLKKEHGLMIEKLEKSYSEKEQDMQKTFEELKSEFSGIQEKIKNYEEQNSRQVKVIKNLKENIEKQKKEIKDKEKKLEKALLADEKLVSKISDLNKEVKEKTEAISEKQDKIEELKKTISDLDNDFEKLNVEYQNIKEQKTGLIQGKENIISIMNNMLDNVKIRVLICTPTIHDIEQIELQNLNKKVNVRIATFIDLKLEKHKDILDTFSGFPNITFRNFDKQDRWGLEHDREEIILASHSKKVLPMGMMSNDPNHIEFFSPLLSEAWVSGKPL